MSTAGSTTPASSATELAERFGLSSSTARPPLRIYIRRLWERRHFIQAFATSRTVAKYAGSRLGQLWQVLTPLLTAGVYIVIFGLLLNTTRGVDNFVGFLVIGIFVMHYTQYSVNAGARAIANNLNLIRALHFPRAALPVASTVVELQRMLVSSVILAVIVFITGEPLTWAWLLFLPVLALQSIFNLGAAFIVARIGANFRDITQLLPFLLRIWLYMSGVLYVITDRVHGLLADILLINPTAVFIELSRDALMTSHQSALPANGWLLAAAWAAVVFCFGFWFFWRGEETYGRG